MDLAYRTPLLECFRRGEVPRDVRLLAARGALAPRAQEQLALLVWLVNDPDPQVAAVASSTLDALPKPALARFLQRADVSEDIRAFFAARDTAPTGGAEAGLVSPPVGEDEPLVDFESDEIDAMFDEAAEASDGDATGDAKGAGIDEARAARLGALPVPRRLKLALKGTREQRAVLIRDPNKVVAAAVLSSPKLSDTEVEAFARMTNVSEEVLRTIGATRAWTKSYGVTAGLVRNPKTPPAISLSLLPRLTDRDVRILATDRNVPEALRLSARRMLAVTESRKR